MSTRRIEDLGPLLGTYHGGMQRLLTSSFGLSCGCTSAIFAWGFGGFVILLGVTYPEKPIVVAIGIAIGVLGMLPGAFFVRGQLAMHVRLHERGLVVGQRGGPRIIAWSDLTGVTSDMLDHPPSADNQRGVATWLYLRDGTRIFLSDWIPNIRELTSDVERAIVAERLADTLLEFEDRARIEFGPEVALSRPDGVSIHGRSTSWAVLRRVRIEGGHLRVEQRDRRPAGDLGVWVVEVYNLPLLVSVLRRLGVEVTGV